MTNNEEMMMGSGGSGGYLSTTVSTVPGQVYTITVGLGGKSAVPYKYVWESRTATSGFVLIAYGGDI